MIENEKFIFIKYTFFITNDSREIRCALYDKKNKKLVRLMLNDELKNKMGDGPTKKFGWEAGLENDLDNGFPLWPNFVTPEGNFGITLQPSTLKAIVQRPSFDSKSEKSAKLKLLAKSLGSDNNELIIMILQ